MWGSANKELLYWEWVWLRIYPILYQDWLFTLAWARLDWKESCGPDPYRGERNLIISLTSFLLQSFSLPVSPSREILPSADASAFLFLSTSKRIFVVPLFSPCVASFPASLAGSPPDSSPHSEASHTLSHKRFVQVSVWEQFIFCAHFVNWRFPHWSDVWIFKSFKERQRQTREGRRC